MKRIICFLLVLLWFCMPSAASSGKTVAPATNGRLTAPGFAFILDIYGNADMNWTIDDADLDYVRAVMAKTAEPTKYADADDNGVIDEADLAAIQALIDGTANRIVLIDSPGTKVSIDLPVSRVVTMAPWVTRTLVQLQVQDTLVGMDAYTAKGSKYSGLFAFVRACPDLENITNIGTSSEPNKEILASLHADVIFAGPVKPDQTEVLKKTAACPVVLQPRIDMQGVDYAIDNGPYEHWLTMGYVFGKRKRARAIIDFCETEFGKIRSRTRTLSEKEKRSVWFCSGKINRGSYLYSPIMLAGGAMPSASGKKFFGEIQLEQVLQWNPDVIFVQYWPQYATMINDIASNKTLSLLKAVQSKNIYYIRNGRIGYDSAFCAAETWYIAKIVYPERFRDIDVEKRANRMLEFIYGTPGLYTWEIANRPVYKSWSNNE